VVDCLKDYLGGFELADRNPRLIFETDRPRIAGRSRIERNA
jgi:hypothetical protein